MINYAFEILECNRLELRCATVNLTSKNLAERLGFVREGELRQAELLNGEYVNDFVYSLLASEHNKTLLPARVQ